MVRILESLDFTVEGDTIHVPSWRSDVEHYSDIAEEVARFYGYNNIPDTLSNGLTARRGLTDIQQAENLLGSVCRAAGYDEIITYSFISPTYYDKIDLPKDSPLRDSLKILNPLGEDTSIMRTTTLPSMLEILTRNYNFRNKSAKLYELGRVYFKRADGLADEPKVLTLGAYGDDMDFFALKGAVEAVLKQLRIENVRFLADSENPSYHPGRCAKVFSGDRLLGVLGQVHPHVAGNYGVDAELYAAELRFDALYESKGAQPVYQPLPKFPAVTRDIAVVCDKAVTVGELEDAILKGAKGLLKDVALKVEDSATTDSFRVMGRGEMHLSILIETMRREGYELQVSPPHVLTKVIDGKTYEPMEHVVIDVPTQYQGAVMTGLGQRKAILQQMESLGTDRVRLEFRMPSRGLFGYRNQFLTDTHGEGIINQIFDGYDVWAGMIANRSTGSLVSFETGEAVTYGLFNAQQRGTLLVGAGEKVYEGMVIGYTASGEDVDVNVCKTKHLTNTRSSGSDDALRLIPVSKARGRKASLTALVDRMEATAIDPAGQTVFISHGDCLEDAEFVAGEVRRRLGVETVHINYVGPVIGNHSGPGTMALFFLGSER